MIYGYIRVSTDRQTVENQRFEINEFCKKQEIRIDKWIEETVSGTKKVEDRTLGKLLKKMLKDDIIIASELSRLGRSLLMIMSILNQCMETEVQVWTIKDNFRLGADISSKVLAFAFGLSAEIERNLISQRTKESLARKKSNGQHLGRPLGVKSSKTKLTGKEFKIQKLLDKKISISAISRLLGVHRLTVSKFLIENMNYTPKEPTNLQKENCNPIPRKELNSRTILEMYEKGQTIQEIAYTLETNIKNLKKQLVIDDLYEELLAISNENRLKFPSKYRQRNESYTEQN